MSGARSNLKLVVEEPQAVLFPEEPKPEVVEPGTALVVRRNAAEIVASLQDDLAALQKETRVTQARRAARSTLAGIVFAYWANRFNHPRALLDPKRDRLLRERLGECGDNVSDLLWAIDGARRDKYVTGELRDSDGPRDEIVFLFRDRGQVEKFGERVKGFRENEIHPLALKYGLHA